MSVDLVYWSETIAGMVAVAIFVFAIYRALEIGRGLVTRVYRSRAYWSAVVMVLPVISNVVGYVPALSSSLTSALSGVTFVAAFFALLLFIDSNISVARELDFFHRDILHWRRVRRPLLLAMLASSALLFAVAILTNQTYSQWWAGAVLLEFFGLLGAALVYSAAAMVTIARSTYDSTMRRFVRMLAYGIVGLALFVTLWIPLDAVYPSLGDVVTDFIFIGAAYYFYKATMSLTPVGRVEKEAVTRLPDAPQGRLHDTA